MAIKKIFKNLLLRNPSKANYKFILKDWLPLFDMKASSQVLETKRFTANLKTIPLTMPQNKHILVIAPHPDDETFGAGGALMLAKENNCEIDVVIVANQYQGEGVTDNVKKEALAVCERLGANLTLLDYPIKNITPDAADKIKRLLLEKKPDIVMITFLLDDHPDHRFVNNLLRDACRGLEKLVNIEVWAYQIYTTLIANVVVDITEVMPKKKELMRIYKHVSGDRDWVHYVEGMNAMACRFLPGKQARYGEVFFVVPLGEYMELCNLYFSSITDGSSNGN